MYQLKYSRIKKSCPICGLDKGKIEFWNNNEFKTIRCPRCFFSISNQENWNGLDVCDVWNTQIDRTKDKQGYYLDGKKVMATSYEEAFESVIGTQYVYKITADKHYEGLGDFAIKGPEGVKSVLVRNG